jgi:cystathionine beta-lyase
MAGKPGDADAAQPRGFRDETLLSHLGNDPGRNFGIVNPPVYRASTILFPTLADFKNRHEQRYTGITYGLHGTPTTFALADAIAGVEGGYKSVVVSSGLASITMALSAFLRAGDHALIADTAYGPTRAFCENGLRAFGVEPEYYDPLLGADLARLIRPNTKVIFMESPGSLTFEVQDVPAMARLARSRGIVTILDSTWGTPLYFKPFQHGVDLSVHAGTKYISGHSDVMLGVITAHSEAHYRRVRDTVSLFGDCPGPDECYLALRGLRTMGVRLERHQASALRVARWLQDRPEVKRVLYPALPGDPGHALWKRDYRGASGLFGLVLHTANEAAVARMVDPMQVFKIGASWGGYESLIIPASLEGLRSVTRWNESGYLLRLNIGLEDPEDLIEDLRLGLERLKG